MERKKIVPPTLAIVLLVCGSILVLVWIFGKKDTGHESIKNRGPLDGLIKRETDMEKIRERRVEGKIKAISEGILEVEDGSGFLISLKIEGSTPVFFVNENKQAELRQLADLRVSETVSIDYDDVTERVILIRVK